MLILVWQPVFPNFLTQQSTRMYAVILSLVKHRAKECRFTKEHRSCCQAVFFAGASLHVFPARSDAVHPDQIVDRSPPAIQKHTHRVENQQNAIQWSWWCELCGLCGELTTHMAHDWKNLPFASLIGELRGNDLLCCNWFCYFGWFIFCPWLTHQ